MSSSVVKVRGLDSLLFRDARPFSGDIGAAGAQTLQLPLPSTLAGFLRTRIGSRRDWDWAKGGADAARAIAVASPLATRNGEAILPAPRDVLVLDKDAPRLVALRPDTEAASDVPSGIMPLTVPEQGKPVAGYSLWNWTSMQAWLADPQATPVPELITGMPTEERVHVGMDSQRGAGDDGKLFSTQYLSFEDYRNGKSEWGLLARVAAAPDEVTGVGPLGGERRIAVVESAPELWPTCPTALQKALGSTKRVRLVLATPALFETGWQPSWLATGVPPAISGLRLRLISAAVGRREAVSGWDFERRAPKAVRWAVPAGSVFFFEAEGDTSVLAEGGWLQSVSDHEQDRRDGFGLALWGVW